MKRVYTTTDPTEAGILRSLLRDAGIESTLDNEGGADIAIGMATSAIPLGISVDDPDTQSASEILDAHFGTHPLPMDDDPDAPEPVGPEESERLQARVRKSATRWRRRLLVVYFLPAAVAAGVSLITGELAQALWVGTIVLGLLAVLWFISFLLASQVEKKKPASLGTRAH